MTFLDYINSLPTKVTSVRNQKILEIAAACKVDSSTVYNWMTGKHKVRPVYKSIISKMLGIPEDELFPESVEKK